MNKKLIILNAGVLALVAVVAIFLLTRSQSVSSSNKAPTFTNEARQALDSFIQTKWRKSNFGKPATQNPPPYTISSAQKAPKPFRGVINFGPPIEETWCIVIQPTIQLQQGRNYSPLDHFMVHRTGLLWEANSGYMKSEWLATGCSNW